MTRPDSLPDAAAEDHSAGVYYVAVDHLLGALEEGGEHMPEADVERTRAVLRRAAQRLAFTGSHTIVALAGTTGSGKSSIFNRLAGRPLAQVSPRRPTTSTMSAAVWGPDYADDLLDWLEVTERHRVDRDAEGAMDLSGLVLLDLPDLDSLTAEHRAEADRVLRLADVFVWVTDPQKYADSLLHDAYLTQYQDHGTVTLVVLNHADRMRSDQAKACRDDLRRLLVDDGLPDAEVFLTSATTGQGFDALTEALSHATQASTAARERVLADISERTQALASHVPDEPEEWNAEDQERLLAEIHHASGLPSYLDGIEDRAVAEVVTLTRWPVSTVLDMKRQGEVRRLSHTLATHRSEHEDVLDMLDRSQVGQATSSARAELTLAQQDVAASASKRLPAAWADQLEDAVRHQEGDMVRAMDATIRASVQQPPRPAWAWAVCVVQWLLFMAAVGLLGWSLWWVFTQDDGMPMLGPLPVAAVGGVLALVAGDVLGQLSANWAKKSALRQRRRIERKLRHHCVDIARQYVIEPAARVREQHRLTREHLALTARALAGQGHGIPSGRRGGVERRRHDKQRTSRPESRAKRA